MLRTRPLWTYTIANEALKHVAALNSVGSTYSINATNWGSGPLQLVLHVDGEVASYFEQRVRQGVRLGDVDEGRGTGIGRFEDVFDAEDQLVSPSRGETSVPSCRGAKR